MLMATKDDNCFSAPYGCGVGLRPGMEYAAPPIKTEGAPGASSEAGSENRIAFARIFEQSRKRLVRAALRITRNQNEAEDVVQEAALRALMKLQTFRGESRLETWIYTIVSNCALSRLRSPARRRLVSLDSEVCADQNSPRWVALEATMDPEEHCLAYELREIVQSEMQALKAPYRAVIQLCDLEGWSCVEAAGFLKVNQHTLEARLYRGRRTLRQGVLTRVLGNEQPPLHVKQFRIHTAKHRRRRKSLDLTAKG
jgi:RNA polymerase sigma-70 factor (ECF subfamily)